MAEYSINPTNVQTNIDRIYSVISNPEKIRVLTAKVPAEAQDKLKEMEFESNSITLNVGPVGKIKLTVTERVEPTKIVYTAQNSPVPMSITLKLDKVDEGNTTLNGSLNLDIPVFLRPMVDGKIKDALAKVSERLSQIPFDNLNL